MSGSVTCERDGFVTIVELDAPEPNFLDPELVGRLTDALHASSTADGCRAIVLCSTGRHFCAGANFGPGGIGDDRAAAAQRLYGLAVRLFDVPVPVVAAVQGAAVGAGLGLACAADFRVATRTSKFHANFTRLGFHPGFGLTVTLPQLLGRQRASDLLYSGRRIDGTEASAMGLVDRLVEDDAELRPAALRWAAELTEAAPLAVRSIKQTLRGGDIDTVRTAMQHELAEQEWLWQTDDCRAGLEAAAARRQPMFTGR